MRLNVQSDYALRLLMYLTVNRDRLCSVSEIAGHYGISRTHLVKVAGSLSSAAFITASRGRSGGLTLARPPQEVIIADVVRATENDFQIVECFGEASECLVGASCRLKKVLDEALHAFLAVLEQYTLLDLTHRNPKLRLVLLAGAS